MTEADSATPEPNESAVGAAPSFDGFVDRYRATAPVVLAYLMRATGNDRALSEDLTSDVFLRAMNAWKLGNTDAGLEPWLITTARNRLIDHMRRLDVEQRKLALVHSQDPGAFDTDFAGVEAASILACARELPPLQRAVLALRYADDLPIAEIDVEMLAAATPTAMRKRRRMTAGVAALAAAALVAGVVYVRRDENPRQLTIAAITTATEAESTARLVMEMNVNASTPRATDNRATMKAEGLLDFAQNAGDVTTTYHGNSFPGVAALEPSAQPNPMDSTIRVIWQGKDRWHLQTGMFAAFGQYRRQVGA